LDEYLSKKNQMKIGQQQQWESLTFLRVRGTVRTMTLSLALSGAALPSLSK